MGLYVLKHQAEEGHVKTLLLTAREKDEMLSKPLVNASVKEVSDNLPGFEWASGRDRTMRCRFGGFAYVISPYHVAGVQQTLHVASLTYCGRGMWSTQPVELDKAKLLCWEHRAKMIIEIMS